MSNEELAKLIQSGIDVQKNMEKLYVENIGFISDIVKRFLFACRAPYGCDPIIDRQELMNEAYFGIVKAVEGFDADAGASFITYAKYWISQAIRRFLDNCGRVIRIPVHTQAKIYAYNKTSSAFLNEFGRKPTKEEFAICIRMTVKEVEKLEQFMFIKSVTSLDAPLSTDEGEECFIGDNIPSGIDIQQEVIDDMVTEQLTGELWNVISNVVNQNMLKVLKYRFVNRLTLEQTAERMHINREAVRNLENNALRRLRNNHKTKDLLELIA